jgi:hypothetical protein
MPDLIKRYQSSMFGNFHDLDWSSESMQELFKIFLNDGLIPSSLQEFNIATQSIVNRPNFVSQNNKYSVSFASERIDIVCNSNEINFDGFLEKINLYNKGIIEIFNSKINRLSYIEERNIVLETENGLYLNLVNNNLLYNKDQIFEWSINNVSHENMILYATKAPEKINIGSTIIKRQVEIQKNTIPTKMDSIILLLDINTVGENTTPRFNLNDVTTYYSKIKIIREKIIKQMEGVLFKDVQVV